MAIFLDTGGNKKMTTKVKFPNSRMASISMSGGIREILTRAEEMEREGRSIIHMEIGRPTSIRRSARRSGW